MSRRLAAQLLVACLLIGPATTRAHDLWLEPEPGGYRLLYGHHPQLVSHGGETRIAYAPAIVKSALCVDSGGSQRPAKLGSTYPVRLEGDCAVAYVLTSSGYWTKTTAGAKNLKKTEVTAPLSAWQSFESVKQIGAWGEGASRPLGAALEIVPAENPLALHDGDKLTVRVLANGQPVPNAVVTYDGKPRGETGADGAVNIRVRHGGMQLVQASVRTPHAGPEADEVVHTTALTFALGAAQ
jgi:nickel transport protein